MGGHGRCRVGEPGRPEGDARRRWTGRPAPRAFWKVPDTAARTRERTLRAGVSAGLALALGFRRGRVAAHSSLRPVKN